MGAFKITVRAMFTRPFTVVFFGLVVLIYVMIDYYNPVFTIVFGFSTIGKGNILDSIIPFLQLIFNLLSGPRTIPTVLPYFLGTLIAVSLLMGLVFSGYMNIIHNTLENKPGYRGEFLSGIRKYFFKISSISFRVLLLGFLFIVFMMVVSVPAIVTTRASNIDKPEIIIAAVFIDILTVGVLFFGFMFFRIYLSFWYPAVFNYEKMAFSNGKRVADTYFWGIVRRFAAFDIIFIIIQFLFMYAGYSIIEHETGKSIISFILFILKWVFEALFFSTYIVYVFSVFKILDKNS